MKILYLASSPIPSRAANSVHVIKMCSAFRRAGLRVILSVARSTPDVHVEDVLRRYDGDPRLDVAWRRDLGKSSLIKSFSLVLVLIQHGFSADYIYSRSLLGALLARLLGRRICLEIHEDIIGSSLLKRMAVKAIAAQKGINKIVVISHALKRHLVERHSISADKIKVAPDGADKVEAESRQRRQGRPDDTHRRVGYVGSLLPGKGVDVVVELATRLPALHFTIVGGTFDEVQKVAEGRDLPNNLMCMGYVDNKDIRRIIEGFDICLLPNGRRVKGIGGTEIGAWTSPLKLFEYMAVGRPIVASDLPVLREILVHKRNAWLCEPDNHDKWVVALCRLSQDDNLARELGWSAREDFERKYTWDSRALDILETCFGVVREETAS